MSVEERIRLCRALETMKCHKQTSENLGLKDTSEFININQQQYKKKEGGSNEIHSC